MQRWLDRAQARGPSTAPGRPKLRRLPTTAAHQTAPGSQARKAGARPAPGRLVRRGRGQRGGRLAGRRQLQHHRCGHPCVGLVLRQPAVHLAVAVVAEKGVIVAAVDGGGDAAEHAGGAAPAGQRAGGAVVHGAPALRSFRGATLASVGRPGRRGRRGEGGIPRGPRAKYQGKGLGEVRGASERMRGTGTSLRAPRRLRQPLSGSPSLRPPPAPPSQLSPCCG